VQEHHDLGRDLVDYPLDLIVAVGEFAQLLYKKVTRCSCLKLKAFATQADALIFLTNLIQHQPESMSFLFKGSRYTHMETLMADLMEKL
jgi:UDP-N-acetylmuramoyl-tripeptide--D-alanyl-D-alanine ligase